MSSGGNKVKPVFHSDNLSETKAKEKRAVFVNVVETKTKQEQLAEVKAKLKTRFTTLKDWLTKVLTPKNAHLGTVTAGQHITSKPPFPLKRFLIIVISAATLIVLGIIFVPKAAKLLEISPENAAKQLYEHPRLGIWLYDQLISRATTSEEKANYYLTRASNLTKDNPQNCPKNQILNDFYKYDELTATAESAYQVYGIESFFGNTEAAEEWLQTAINRGFVEEMIVI
ncbi:hypothetical protein IJH29_00070 [Candidatus Saccharibacteria bacterium]|nr:hypothetical protein [Candidatus Saccharibacteria bacterium]